MVEKDSLFRLRWDNQGSLLESVASLFHEEAFVDTTIFTEGKLFKAHRLLLSASSSYLKHVLQSVPGDHHSVLLLPQICARDFEHVLKFIYEGEIKIKQRDLKSFLHVARILKIKGLDFDDEETEDLLGDEQNYSREHSKLNQNSTAAHQTINDHSRPSKGTSDNEIHSTDHSNNNEPKDRQMTKVEPEVTSILQRQLNHSIRPEYEDYDEKEIMFLSGDDEDEVSGDPLTSHGDIVDGGESDEEHGLPLLPEVSMEVEGSFDLKHMPIMQQQVSSRSWSIPHSSTSANGNRGGNYDSKQNVHKKAFGDGILMRMMREPLKSSVSSQAQVLFDIDETGQRRTKRYVQCSSCSKVLSSLSALKRHMEDVHCARIQGKCLICGRVYSSRNSLLTHVYSAHKKHHDYKAVARIIRESDFESFATTAT